MPNHLYNNTSILTHTVESSVIYLPVSGKLVYLPSSFLHRHTITHSAIHMSIHEFTLLNKCLLVKIGVVRCNLAIISGGSEGEGDYF